MELLSALINLLLHLSVIKVLERVVPLSRLFDRICWSYTSGLHRICAGALVRSSGIEWKTLSDSFFKMIFLIFLLEELVHRVFITCSVVEVSMTCLESGNKSPDCLANVTLSWTFLRKSYLYHLDWNDGHLIQWSFQFQLSSADVVIYEAICHMHAWPS